LGKALVRTRETAGRWKRGLAKVLEDHQFVLRADGKTHWTRCFKELVVGGGRRRIDDSNEKPQWKLYHVHKGGKKRARYR